MKSKAPFKRGQLLTFVSSIKGSCKEPRLVKYKSYGGPMRPRYVWVTDVKTGKVFGCWDTDLTPVVQNLH